MSSRELGAGSDRAAHVVPGITGAALDGECYYYVDMVDSPQGDQVFEDGIFVDADDLASPDQGADWMFREQQAFYNSVYSDGVAPDGEGCERVDDLAVPASWCWAKETRSHPTLLVLTPNLGIRIVGWDPVEDMTDGSEQAQRRLLVDIAERILGNTGLAVTTP